MMAGNSAMMWRRKLMSKAKFESSSIMFQCLALTSRRFERGFDRVKLHRPTMMRLAT